MMNEYRFFPVVRMDEAVTILAVKPTPDYPRSLVQ